MGTDAESVSFFIGWDVGGWNCEKNRKSRDAVVILDGDGKMQGVARRGNLRGGINDAGTTREWLKDLFTKCEVKMPEGEVRVTMAIDAPLGFSAEFVKLITRQGHEKPDETSGLNRYLFRETERHLFDGKQAKPLSAIKDMIGSQATKAMHVLSKFAPEIESCGVWTDGRGFRAIETYPAACKKHAVVKEQMKKGKSLGHADKDDAHVCAVIAYLFATKREVLGGPELLAGADPEKLRNEGWIWVPQKSGDDI